MTDTNQAVLKPCPNPWCAGTSKPLVVSEIGPGGENLGFKVICFIDCNLSGPVKPTQDEAIAAWNDRTPQHPAAGDMDALARELWGTEFDAAGQHELALAVRSYRQDGPRSHTTHFATGLAAIKHALTTRPTLEDISPLAVIETAAKLIYDKAMLHPALRPVELDDEGEPVKRTAWITRGNSDMQMDCRDIARSILALADTALLRTALADQQENIAAHLDEGYREAAERVREWRG